MYDMVIHIYWLQGKMLNDETGWQNLAAFGRGQKWP